MNNRARRSALRDFLMESRARLRPEDVGLVSANRRRVPGLRREEVAELAQISSAWYTLLETGRDIRVSPRMLDRIATALRLNECEKVYLFTLAIDELPDIPRATPDSVGALGREYLELMKFAQRSRSVSTVQELADLAADLLFDLARPVEDAYSIGADLTARQFWFMAQRLAPRFQPEPSGNFDFSSVHDAQKVLVENGIFTEPNVGQTDHAVFSDRARKIGTSRFISKGVHAVPFDGAIGYFQRGGEPHSEYEFNRLGLIAEVVYLALAARA